MEWSESIVASFITVLISSMMVNIGVSIGTIRYTPFYTEEMLKMMIIMFLAFIPIIKFEIIEKFLELIKIEPS